MDQQDSEDALKTILVVPYQTREVVVMVKVMGR
jgi:hypothetical protein